MVFNTIFTNSTQNLITSGNVGIGTTILTNLLGLGPNGAAFPAPSGSAPLYAARAAFSVTYDGTNVTTDTSLNVSSIIRGGVGQLDITFTNNMPSKYYAISGIAGGSASTTEGPTVSLPYASDRRTTSNCRILITGGTSRANRDDVPYITGVIHM